MNAREEAERLRQEAIQKLLDEQKAIEHQLELLGYGKEHVSARRRRGRPPKQVMTLQREDRERITDAESACSASFGSEP